MLFENRYLFLIIFLFLIIYRTKYFSNRRKKKKMEKELGKHNFESLEWNPVFVKRTWMDLKDQ